MPSPADLLTPRIEPGSPALQVDSLPTELSGKTYSILEGLMLNLKLHGLHVWPPDAKN